MQIGDTLELTNDHVPRPLHYRFIMEREGDSSNDTHAYCLRILYSYVALTGEHALIPVAAVGT